MYIEVDKTSLDIFAIFLRFIEFVEGKFWFVVQRPGR